MIVDKPGGSGFWEIITQRPRRTQSFFGVTLCQVGEASSPCF
jgi:hypothetical protein